MPVIKEADWYERRKKGIGGSEAAIVLGISPFKSPLRLWMEKRGEIDVEDIDTKNPVYWGTRLEALIADEYSRRTDLEVVESVTLAVHAEHPWMICNVDRYVKGPGRRILEIKATSTWAHAASDWGEDGSSQVPPYYYAQCQHNMAVTRANQCDMPILIGGNDYRCFHIARDDVFIDRLIVAEKAFIEAIYSGERPEPINDDDLKLLFPNHVKGLHKEADDVTGVAWAKLVQLMPQLNAMKKTATELKYVIKSAMGEAEFLSGSGIDMATWRTGKNGNRTLRIVSRGVDFTDSESCQ